MTDPSQGLGPGGKKNDAGKTRLDLLPLAVLRGVAEVLTYGAKTYDEHSWQHVPRGLARYLAGQGRHFNARVLDGELRDPKSGLLHAWHYACNALFVAWFLAFRPSEVESFRAAHAAEEVS
jgi:hypothetical protein